jgi:hypothetical protein
MAMKLLRVRELADAFKIVVHTDTTKVREDGSPDGNYVRTFRYDKDFASRNLSKTAYLSRIREQIKIELQPSNGTEGTALAGEGNDL